jgi:hypothetical protein
MYTVKDASSSVKGHAWAAGGWRQGPGELLQNLYLATPGQQPLFIQKKI